MSHLPHFVPPRQVESDESLAKVTTEAQRSAFLAQLNEVEEWLYGDGDTASSVEYRWAEAGPDALCCAALCGVVLPCVAL